MTEHEKTRADDDVEDKRLGPLSLALQFDVKCYF
jgi:hypothetical protein